MSRNCFITVELVFLILVVGCGKEEGERDPKKASGEAAAPSGFESPEAAFAAFKSAAEKKDIDQALRCTTRDTQDMMAASLVIAVSFAAAFDPDSEQDVRNLLGKHGIDIDDSGPPDAPATAEPMEAMRTVVKPIKDKVAFIAEAFQWLDEHSEGGGGPDEGMERLAKGQLTELQINGDKATAQVTTTAAPDIEPMPIEFRKQDGVWLVHLAEMKSAVGGPPAGSFPPDEMGGFPGDGAGDEFSDADWPDTPELMATIVGQWELAAGGEINFSDKTTRDELGFENLTGTYTPKEGEAVEFQWKALSDSFGQLDDGGKRSFEATLMITADKELPFTADGSTNILVDVSNTRKAILQFFPDAGSLETTDLPMTKK